MENRDKKYREPCVDCGKPRSRRCFRCRKCYRKNQSKVLIGRKLTNAWKENIRKGQSGEKSHRWLGDSAGYAAIHKWINKQIKKESCKECRTRRDLQLANISGQYKRTLTDWIVLCRSCHQKQEKGVKNKKFSWSKNYNRMMPKNERD